MDFNFNIPELEIDLDLSLNIGNSLNNRYQKSKDVKELPQGMVKYSNAKKLAKDTNLFECSRYNCIISGNFIFGDYIEALLVEHNIKCSSMTISTLSMDQNNVDSLNNLLEGDYLEELNLIVSDYFYSHERGALIPYIYNSLDINNKFQLAVAGSHTKICLMQFEDGRKVVIHGSANLRSSSNIEQFVVEVNEELYDFWLEYHKDILKEYATINKDVKKQKSIRGKRLWQVVQQREEVEVRLKNPPKQQKENQNDQKKRVKGIREHNF